MKNSSGGEADERRARQRGEERTLETKEKCSAKLEYVNQWDNRGGRDCNWRFNFLEVEARTRSSGE